ncbi:MAG: hypothetical protein Q9M17_03910, partial [Mariprofundus sp.]|nr:hypothetical protein [Mariprofundus sp.]
AAIGGAGAAVGTVAVYNATALTTSLEMKKWMIDFQAQGELGDMQVGIYADYAKAGAGTATRANLFSKLGGESSGYSVRANIKPLHTVIVNAGFGIMRDADLLGAVTKTTQFQVGAEYEIYQNFVVALIYNNTKSTTAANFVTKTKTTTLDIEALL